MNVSRLPVRELCRALIDARDDQIVRVVAMVDAMPDRGPADGLVAPLRARLAQIRPPRRPSLVRLMFTPLDPLIVPGREWRRGAAAIPRTALSPLAQAARARAGAALAELEARIAGCPDIAQAEALVGPALWTQAARALDGAPPPPQWYDATALGEADFAVLSRAVSALLSHAAALPGIERAAERSGVLPDDGVRAILTAVAPLGPETWALAVSLLLARLPFPDRVIQLATEIANDPGARIATEAAMDEALDRIEQSIGGAALRPTAELGMAADEAERIALLLSRLDTSRQRAERRRRVEQLRREAEAACRRRLAQGLDTELLTPIQRLAAPASDQQVFDLEAAARELRRIESAGRRLSNGERADTPLAGVFDELRSGRSDLLSLADRARLVEILLGPEKAFEMLSLVPPPAPPR